jgi:hypothetical protein
MKSLIFTNGANIRVEYVVDLLGSNSGNLTVMEIKGLDTAEEALFKGFQKLPNNLAAFKAFATTNHLQLIERDQDTSSVVVNATTTTTTAAPTTTTTTVAP